MTRRFIIYVPSFDENIGGNIALHRLCDLLNRQGETARLWPYIPRVNPGGPLKSAVRTLFNWRDSPLDGYRTCEGFQTPIADSDDLKDAIVVYPEIVNGNPLRAKHVVRWLLHKPGFHTGSFEFGAKDKFFFYQKAFDIPELNPDGDNLLRTVYLRDDIYRQTNFGPRQGTCHILRKGKNRPMAHPIENSILVDDFSHQEMADVFNRVERCISYDTYTMYSHFAALCGCDSIIVPEEGVSKEQWYPDPADRFGLAYGFDDVENARETRPLLLAHLKAQESQANSSVGRFVMKCQAYFPD
jgi:hypothetical protein